MLTLLIAFGTTFAIAMLVGTVVEYWAHRLMHTTRFFRKSHVHHHKDGLDGGWVHNALLYYLPRVLPLITLSAVCILFGVYWLTGSANASGVGMLGWLCGGAAYCLLLAWTHEQQHERGTLHRVWWLSYPVHYHHTCTSARGDYGIVTWYWDWVFGTLNRRSM